MAEAKSKEPTTEQIDRLLESFEAWVIEIGQEDFLEVMMEDVSLFLHPFLMEKKKLAFSEASAEHVNEFFSSWLLLFHPDWANPEDVQSLIDSLQTLYSYGVKRMLISRSRAKKTLDLLTSKRLRWLTNVGYWGE